MLIEFDPLKNAVNQQKHGLSLQMAEGFSWGTAFYQQDIRKDYGEPRFYALGFIGPRLHALIFTPRGAAVRMISLRKANRREVRFYEQQKPSHIRT
jgi:uncharacterized DUF497 family protein